MTLFLFLEVVHKEAHRYASSPADMIFKTKKRIPTLRLYEDVQLRFSSVWCCQPVSVDQAYRVNRYGFLWYPASYAHHSTMATKKMNFNLCFRQGREFSAN
jgi:hypothetical protein